MTIKQLLKAWITQPTTEILELILDEIDWDAVLDDITNESGGCDFLDFVITADGVYWFDVRTNETIKPSPKYIGRLRCAKGDYDYLWDSYAHFNSDTELYDTVEGESLTKQQLRKLCLEDGDWYATFEHMRSSLVQSAYNNNLYA